MRDLNEASHEANSTREACGSLEWFFRKSLGGSSSMSVLLFSGIFSEVGDIKETIFFPVGTQDPLQEVCSLYLNRSL